MKCDNCDKKVSFFQEAPPIGDMRICMDCYENYAEEIRKKASDQNYQSEQEFEID